MVRVEAMLAELERLDPKAFAELEARLGILLLEAKVRERGKVRESQKIG
jgi:hypothetical protein